MAMAGQAGQYAPQYSAGYSYQPQFSVTPQPQFGGMAGGMGGMAGGLGGMAGGFNAPFGGFGGFPQGGLGPQAPQSMDPEQISDQKRKALEYLDNQKAQALETAGKHAESQKQMIQTEAAQDMLRLDQQYHQMLHQTEQQRSQQLMQIEQMAIQLNAQAERNKNMKEMYDKYQANAPQGNPGVQPGLGSPMPMGVMSPQMGPGVNTFMPTVGNAYAAAPMSYPR